MKPHHIIKAKDFAQYFNCSNATAYRKMKHVRQSLNIPKQTPLLFCHVLACYGLN